MDPETPMASARSDRPAGVAPHAARPRVAWKPLLIVVVVLAAALGADWSRAPRRQLSTRAALAAIDLYQATLSRGMDEVGVRCRFEPTCSRYGEAVIARDGIARGGLRALWRIARCGPWTPQGTVDPPGPAAAEEAAASGGERTFALDQ